MIQVFFHSPTENNDVIQISNCEIEIFNIPVMSSWNKANACASPKGSLIYLYFPNGKVNAVLDIEVSSKGIWWYPDVSPMFKKYLAPFNWMKMSSTLGVGQINFLVTLLSVQ